jgi:hypothetical protein
VNATEPLTELEAMLTADERRIVTVADHEHFLRSISTDNCGRDEIDRALDEQIVIDPYVPQVRSRRSDEELARVLSILDSLDEERS